MRAALFAIVYLVSSGPAPGQVSIPIDPELSTLADTDLPPPPASKPSAKDASAKAESAAPAPAGPGAPVDPFPQFVFDGSVSGVYEFYDADGDKAQSPYTFLEDQHYVDFHATGIVRRSRFETVRASVFGVYNESLYRNRDYDDLIVERANLQWEKGDGILPFRAEAGDFFGNLSLRTLQRSLKGAQVEVQPGFPGAGANSSLLVFGGQTTPIYRDVDIGEDVYSGASYLISSPLGDVSFNYVHNYREAGPNLSEASAQQQVASIAGETDWRLGTQKLNFEFEAARFMGDYGALGSALTRDVVDYGVFAELSGRSLAAPLTYSLLYERYGQDFRPRGGSVSADHEAIGARAGWRFANGLLARGRLQQFKDALETTDPVTTYTAGLDLIGPFSVAGWPWPGLTGSILSFVSDVENRSGSRHTTTWSLSPNFSSPLADTVNADWGGSYTRTEDHVAKSLTQAADLFAGLDWSFGLGPFVARLSPAMTVRRAWSPTSDVYDYGPRIGIDIAGDGHSFSADYAYLFQDGHDPTLTDNESHNVSASYTYTHGIHQFGVETDYIERDTDPGTRTRSYRTQLRYTLNFSYPAALGPAAPAETISVPGVVRLADLYPGLTLADARKRLDEAAFVGGVETASTIVYELGWLPGIDQRQRLALVHDGRTLSKSALLISMDDVGDGRTAEQLYARVRDALIRRYGTPSTFEEGDFGADFADAIRHDRLIRIAEWSLPQGTLRLGLPNRLDRTVQIEIQFARGFPAPNQTRWRLNEIR